MKKLINILLSFLFLLLIWHLLIFLTNKGDYFLPSPRKVLSGFIELASTGVLFIDLFSSLYRFFIGYVIALIFGIPLGLLFGLFTRLWGIVNPVVQLIRPISPIAWFPFVVLWFGIGDLPSIIIIFIAAFFPILLSTVSAVQKVDPLYMKISKNFGLRKRDILLRVIFPAAFPYITIGLHVALGTSWVFLVAGEMVGAQSGLGYLIIDSRNNLRTDLVMVGIIFIGLLGLLLDKIITMIENRIMKNWGLSPNIKDVI